VSTLKFVPLLGKWLERGIVSEQECVQGVVERDELNLSTVKLGRLCGQSGVSLEMNSFTALH
jgi:hypothetical protein